jgi:uncharacterized protein (TIGR02594 family)
MTVLPAKYAFLSKEKAPKMLLEAIKLHGTHEVQGSGDNPEILAWAREFGEPGYKHDDIAWCGLFVGVCAKRARCDVVKDPLWARYRLKFGTATKTPVLGDVLVFARGISGHVGI